MVTLEELIEEIRARKKGNDDFALFGLYDGTWEADIGNRSGHVMLGEIRGEFSAKGTTMREALEALLAKLD
jgi:hypothetical protein